MGLRARKRDKQGRTTNEGGSPHAPQEVRHTNPKEKNIKNSNNKNRNKAPSGRTRVKSLKEF